MHINKQRLKYFFQSAFRYAHPPTCQGCGSSDLILSDRKILVTRLFTCRDCHLSSRHPPDKKERLFEFYQEEYAQDDGITTTLPMPDATTPAISVAGNRSAERLKPLLDSLTRTSTRPMKTLLDYGASWGYMTSAFSKMGYQAEGFEISKPRAAAGEHSLGIKIHTDQAALVGTYDFCICSHVIEHVPNPSQLIETLHSLLSPGGFALILCPNGSQAFRDRSPMTFHHLWGQVHPHLLSEKYFQQALKGWAHFIGNGPDDPKIVSALERWDGNTQICADEADCPELMGIFRKTYG